MSKFKMKAYGKLIQSLLLTAGIIETIIGIAHFAFPTLTLESGGFLQLHASELDFVILNMTGLGINLTVFGILTIICAVKYDVFTRMPLYLTSAQAIKYLIRITFECLFPASIPILFLRQPSLVVAPVLIVLWGLHSFSVILILRDKRKL